MIHKQVKVSFFGKKIEVDENLAELLQLIWKRDIMTCNSCQENQPGIAWIEFLDSDDFKSFINEVAQYPKKEEVFWETLYGRIVGCGSKDDWQYNMLLENDGVLENFVDNEIIQEYMGYNEFHISVSARFPVSDIQLLVDILKN